MLVNGHIFPDMLWRNYWLTGDTAIYPLHSVLIFVCKISISSLIVGMFSTWNSRSIHYQTGEVLGEAKDERRQFKIQVWGAYEKYYTNFTRYTVALTVALKLRCCSHRNDRCLHLPSVLVSSMKYLSRALTLTFWHRKGSVLYQIPLELC